MSEISVGEFKAYRLTAIISLVFALVGFTYNAWRLEQSEENNIVRDAAFQILIELAEFEQILYASHYDRNPIEGSPRTGWIKVGLINDLALLVDPVVVNKSASLKTMWSEKWPSVPDDVDEVNLLVEGIDDVREAVKARLAALD